MFAARIAGCSRGKETVFIGILWRYDTVGRHQDRSMEGRKFFRLFPPCISVIADKMLILFKRRIIMGRQHFRMGIYIHAAVLCLLQKHFQIPQIVSGYQNARALAHTDIDLCNLRITIGFRVGSIQKCHALHAILSCLQCQRHQIIHG